MTNVHMCELSQKCWQVYGGLQLHFFSIFWKIFENEEKHHIFTSGQLKYKISLICLKNVHMCELNQKCWQVRGGQNFNFFDFLKSFRKWRKASYFHFNTINILKFTHLDDKWVGYESHGRAAEPSRAEPKKPSLI